MDFRDYYADLGLTPSASDDEIKSAFRKLARQYHPDVNPTDPTAEDKFKKVSEAYEVLGDVDKRRKYDSVRTRYTDFQSSGGKGGSTTFDDFGDMFQGTSMSDLFEELFGGRQRRTRTTSRKPQETLKVYTVKLMLEEVFRGVKKRLVLGDAKIDVTFKPGTFDGQRLKVPVGQLEVHVLPHPKYTRTGDDISTTTSVPLSTLVLGGTIDIEVFGASVTMKIPAGTAIGKKFRIARQGFPSYEKPDVRGDLYVTVTAQIPTTLTDEQRAAFESVRDLGL